MKFRLIALDLMFRGEAERLTFDQVNYFYGKMGAGKSTIARLIDYCLGGSLEYTPALQSHFVSASLELNIGRFSSVTLQRNKESHQVLVRWADPESKEPFAVNVPARIPAEQELTPGVAVLSDLLFILAGLTPPRVRRSKLKEESETGRLSFRDLFWYCYLDQGSMDSSFFHLDPAGDTYKRLKSRDVLRYVLGFHQDKVIQLEAQLEELTSRRDGLQVGASALKDALASIDLAGEIEIEVETGKAREALETVEAELNLVRQGVPAADHAVGQLRNIARASAAELAAAQDAVVALQTTIASETRHLNEIKTMSLKSRRAVAARAHLLDVEFRSCPRCSQALPPRAREICNVCGQIDVYNATEESLGHIDRDLKSRQQEIEEFLEERRKQLSRARAAAADAQRRKVVADRAHDEAMRDYDSQNVSQIVMLESRRAVFREKIDEYERLKRLPAKISEMLAAADVIAKEQAAVRRALNEARALAEQDLTNLRELERLFLDCLVRSSIPGIRDTDVVSIQPPGFLPIILATKDSVVVTSFDTMGSGGKKSLFKCCFAIALHRLAAKIRAPALPALMMFDTPMKNISERENREQFEAFHRMVYELADSELADTQFVLIDKEHLGPTDKQHFGYVARHMTPDDPENPPLIRSHRGA